MQGSDAAVVEREGHAAMSARHLSEARDRIERQRELIDHLRRLGFPTARSETLLKLFEEIMASMLVHDAIIRRGARGWGGGRFSPGHSPIRIPNVVRRRPAGGENDQAPPRSRGRAFSAPGGDTAPIQKDALG